MGTPRKAPGADMRSAVTPPDQAATNWDWLQTDPAEYTYRRKTRALRTPTRGAAPPRSPYPNNLARFGTEGALIDFTPEMFIPSRTAPLPPTRRRSPSAAADFGWRSPTPASPMTAHSHRPASPAGAPRRGVSNTLNTLAGSDHVPPAPAMPSSGASTGLRTSKSLHNLTQGAVPDQPRAANFLATPPGPPYASLTSASIRLHHASCHPADYAPPARPWSRDRPASPSARPPSRRAMRGDSSGSSYSPSPGSEETTGTAQSAWTDPPSPVLGWTRTSSLPGRKPTRSQ